MNCPEAYELQGQCCKNQTTSLVATEKVLYLIFLKMLLKTGYTKRVSLKDLF